MYDVLFLPCEAVVNQSHIHNMGVSGGDGSISGIIGHVEVSIRHIRVSSVSRMSSSSSIKFSKNISCSLGSDGGSKINRSLVYSSPRQLGCAASFNISGRTSLLLLQQ